MRGQTPHGGCFGGAGRHIWGCRTWPLWDPAQAPGVGGTRLQALNWERVLAWYWVLLAWYWGILASSWGTWACLLGSQAPGWKMLLEGRGGCGAGAPRWPRGYIHSSSAERRQPGGGGGPRTFVAVREGPRGGPGCPPPALLLGRTLGSAAPFNCG